MNGLRSSIAFALVAVLVLVLPGCLLGSPLAAIGGEVYGQTRDDITAVTTDKKGPIWSGAPVFAAIDLPMAFVLDTAFLPISLIAWAIVSASDDDGDEWELKDHGER